MLPLKWLSSFSVVTSIVIAASVVFASKGTPQAIVLAKDVVLSLPSQPGRLKGINSRLIAQKEPRLALIIGNANYEEGALSNPVNDAKDMAEALGELGFEVTLLQNQDLRGMEEAIDNFNRQLRQGGVGLFYYAGHGVQVEGENYLIPLKAKLQREKDVKYEAYPLGKVLHAMEDADNQINIIIMDACRNNSYYRRWRSNGRSLASRGLAAISPPSGIIIAYATKEGNVAEDGIGQRNSPFTSALLKHIKTPNLDVQLMFRRVSASVRQKTGAEQEPWTEGNLRGDEFYLNPQSVATSSPPPQNNATSNATISIADNENTLIAQVQDFIKLGKTKIDDKDYQGAIEPLSQAISLDPESLEAYFLRGTAYQSLEDYQKALQDYSKAIAIDPKYADAYDRRSYVYLSLGDWQKSVQDYSKRNEIEPQKKSKFIFFSRVSSLFKNDQEKIRYYSKAIQINSKDIIAYEDRADVYWIYLKDYRKALQDYSRIIKIDPKNARIYTERGDLYYYMLKDYQKALDDYNKAIEIDPENSSHYYYRAKVYFSLKEYKKSIQNGEKALELSELSLDTLPYRPDFEDERNAIEYYNQAIELYPQKPYYYYWRGESYLKLKEYQKALKDCNKAIEIDPKSSDAYDIIGQIYADLKEYEKAIQNYNKAIKFNSFARILLFDSYWVYYRRGNAYYDLKEYQKAVEDYSKVISSPLTLNVYLNAHSYYWRGQSYRFLGDKQKAINDFRESAKIYQSNNNQEWYQNSLDRLQELGVSN